MVAPRRRFSKDRRLPWLGWFLAWLCFSTLACQQRDPEAQFHAKLDAVLAAGWQFYAKHFIQPDGRVIRPENGHDTVSEGQAYTLLRAVWSNDQATFDRVYQWTEAHLSHKNRTGRHLLAWHFGQDEGGRWRVLDDNSATDADLDYALALVLAHRRWGSPAGTLPGYREKALLVRQDILAATTCRDPWGRLWLTPGNWVACRQPLLLNPSYFAPAWFEIFYWLDGDRGWLQLADSSYQALTRLSRRLGEQEGVGLVPDWCLLQDKEVMVPASGRSADFGWEAIRVPWRVGLAALWFQDERAVKWLKERFLPFARQQWQEHGRLFAVYTYDGQPLVDYDSPVLYASLTAAALAAGDRPLARQAVEKILTFYREDPDGGYFNRPDDYYNNNWAWFGLATYRGLVTQKQ